MFKVAREIGRPLVLTTIALLLATACGTTQPRSRVRIDHRANEPYRTAEPTTRARPTGPGEGDGQQGKASWYGPGFQGRKTASGERFDMHDLTAAHRRLPFGTQVRVTNLKNGRSVVVRINDRGPFGGGRIIDLSRAAAERLLMIRSGVVPVAIEVLGRSR